MAEIKRVAIYPDAADELCRTAQIERYIPQKERDSYDAADFAGPDRSFPITSQAQLDAAAHLIGHAADPDAVKAKAKAIAKRKGYTLPKAWQEDDGEKKDDAERAVLPDVPEHPMLYLPIIRIDKEKREVEGVATSEAIDSYKTIFSYEASKKAFQQWIERTANCREMHDRRAVGKGIGVFFDDTAKQVVVRSRVSRSADGENTWTKIEEGILNGYSVGATNPVWDTVERDGKKYPYLVSYDLSELSYVDNASNPDAQGLALCRADGLTELVDVTEETPPPAAPPPPEVAPVERAGARLSVDSRAALHGMRDQAMQLCSCEDCQRMMGADEPDADDRAAMAVMERALSLLIERSERIFAPVYQREQHFLARLAVGQTPEELANTIHATTLFEERMKESEERILAAIERMVAASSQSEVRADLSAVKATVERIAATPMPGGPVLNGAQPVDKRLATQPSSAYSQQQPHEDTLALLRNLQASGALDTPDKQVAAAALAAIPVRGRMG